MKRMCEGLRHRGPDDEGHYSGTNIALGHRALRLGSAPLIHQPLTNEDKTIWITFDGEIYNKDLVMQQLQKNHTLETDSSAEVVVHSYEEKGPECLNQLNGMFAFCLWDLVRERLFCARDRFGMKPFYYFASNGTFLQASEIKALLPVLPADVKPNETVVYDYLVTAHDDHTEETYFADIKRLPPAHYLLIDETGVKLRKYWSPKVALKTKQSSKEDQCYASELRTLLRDSIKIRLPVNLPVGTYLSGGIDSTSIAYLVNDILSTTTSVKSSTCQNQELFSAVFRGPIEQGDEKPYIDDMVRTIKAETHYISPSVSGKWGDLREFVYCVEEPVAQINYYVFWCLSRKAKEKVQVVFYGHGTGILGELESVDEYMHYFKELWKQREITRLLREIVGAIPRMTTSSVKTLSNIWTRKGESGITRFLAPQFAALFSEGAQIGGGSGRSAYDHWVMGNLVDCLRGSDLVSSVFSLEASFPFLDHRIVEFALSLPNSQRIRNGLSKYVLRNAMKGGIPETVRMSRKHFGTPVPLQRWMKELRPNMEEIFKSRKFRERGYFNQPAVIEAYRRFCEGQMDGQTSSWHAYVFWRILNLELWLEAFFDPENKISGGGTSA